MKHFKLFSLLFLLVVSSAILLAGGTKVKPAQKQASKHDYKSQPRSHARTIGVSSTVRRGGGGNALNAFLINENFEAGLVPPTGWTLTNPDVDLTWESVTALAGHGGGAYIDFYDYGPGAEGELDMLATPTVVGLAATDSLIFDYAYTDYSATFSDDSLIVEISTNGGSTFSSIYRNGPPSLRTAPSTTSAFVPTAGQWATLRFGLPAGVVGNSVVVRFVGKNNYGNNLYIDNVTLGSPSTDDVGMFSIDISNPSGAGSQTPKATVKNFGLATATFPVTMNISPGAYSSTQTVTSLVGGGTSQVSFASWSPVPGSYSVTVYTNLGADASRANDTLRTTILVIDSVTGSWSSLAGYSGGAAGGIANYWWAESSKVFTAGGGGDVSNFTSSYFYDPISNTYTAKASLPVGRAFGKMVRVRDGLFLVSSTGASFTAPDGALYRYDPAANTWTARASTPATLIQESGVCVWNDSLIITIGGSSNGFTAPVNSVRVYNTFTDGWTILAAPFPVAAMGLAAECIGNEIIVLGGVVAGPAISNVAYRGTVIPGSPISISWRATTNPYGQGVYRSASATWSGRMMFGPTQSGAANIGTIWGINIADSTIRKYVPPMPIPLGNIPNMAVQASPAAVNFYMFGGYNGAANQVSASKYSISLAGNDIAATSVDDPVAGAGKKQNFAFDPKATFTNVGTATQSSIPVRMKIFDRLGALVYLNNQTITSLASSSSQQVTFGSFTPTDTGTYTARAIALNPADINGTNDSTTVSFPILIVVSTFPYTENFEGPVARPAGKTDQILSGGIGWSSAILSGVVNDWLLGTPAKTQLSGAHSGTKCYVTKDTGTYNNSQDAAINSPVFDFTSLSSDPNLEFWHNFQSETGYTGYDAGVVEYSTNGGLAWLRVEDSLGHVATPDSNWTTLNAFNWYNVNSINGPIDGYKYSSLAGASTGSAFYTGNVAGWIKSTVKLVGTAGLSDVRLRFRWGTDGSVVAEGWAIDDVSILPATSTTTLNVGIALGWNLISNPVTNPVPGDSVRQMYPTSLNAYAFEFAGGYVQKFILANGKGYWEKFPGAISAPVTGTLRTRDSVSVATGWNIVGSISNTVDTNTIVSVPPGLRASNWFGYSSGYTAVTQLVPGKGYWVKSTAAGKFVLANPLARPAGQGSGTTLSDVLNTLTITDANGGSQTLYFGADGRQQIPVAMYAMPPAPPVGGFDARFETADGGSMVQTHGVGLSTPVEFAVSVQSEAYPLTITWKVANASYTFSDGVQSKDMTGEGSMKITNSSASRFSVKLTGDSQLPKDYALSQNYPNPFNPTTSIKYALPVDSKVTMEIYNVLGQRVATLLNEVLPAGYHAIEWNSTGTTGQQLGSGVYFLQLSAEGSGRKFSEIRKLMLLK